MNTTQKNVWILSFTLLVVMLGYGMVMPVMPFLITQLGAGGTEMGWMTSSYALMQLIFAPLWGIASDRVGRKPILMLGILGYAVALLLFGLAKTFPMLFFARVLSGILSSATMPTAMAYIGDNAPEKERSGGMGKLGAAMGAGVVLGPLVGGWLSADSFSFPFFLGSGLAALALVLVALILPEAQEKIAQRKERKGFNLAAARAVLIGPAGVLLLLIFIMAVGLANFQSIIGLYLVQRLAFDTAQVGWLWMAIGGIMILAQGLLTERLTKWVGERVVISGGLLVGAAGMLGILVAVNFSSMMTAVSILCLGLALMGPAMNAHISVFAGEHQGAVMGMNSASASLGRVIGPLWAGWLFDINTGYPFLSGAGILLLGFLVSLLALRKKAAG